MAGKKTDDALIVALAGGKAVQAAAKLCGVSERTAYRRLADDDFRQRVVEARGAMVAMALGRLADASTVAARTLRHLLRKDVAPTVRLGAARAILEVGNRLRENVEIEKRLMDLERKAEHGHNRQTTGEPRNGNGAAFRVSG